MSSAKLTVPGFKIGHAHDASIRTGVSVIYPDTPARCAVDVRGGGPGTRETDTLAYGGLIDRVHAVVLAGGSVYGLAAADGVSATLGAQNIGFQAAPPPVPVSPIVPTAILFDNANGGDKAWGTNPPYRALGISALETAAKEIVEGRVGAGYGAMAGLHPGGLGVASESDGARHVCAIIAANPVGSPYIPGTDVPHAWMYERDGEFGGKQPAQDYAWTPPTDTKLTGRVEPGQNTVIGAVLTNVALSQTDLKRLAIMAQDGIAMAVQPSHTPLDGDTIFAMSVGEEISEGPVALSQIGAMAARATARALTRGVLKAKAT